MQLQFRREDNKFRCICIFQEIRCTAVHRKKKVAQQHAIDRLIQILQQTKTVEYWRHLEQKFRIDPTYMQAQPYLGWHIRTIVVDWLFYVAFPLKLHTSCRMRMIGYLDRFLQKRTIATNKMQLVAVATLWIAAKFEHRDVPRLADLVYICHDAYSKEQILKMEWIVLTTLEFGLFTSYPQLHVPFKGSKQFHTIVSFYLEWMNQFPCFLHFSHAVLAASAVRVACQVLRLETPPFSHESEEVCTRLLITALHPNFETKYRTLFTQYQKYFEIDMNAYVPKE